VPTNLHRPSSQPDGADDSSDELVMFLERDQLSADTSIPVPRAQLGRRAQAALWALRIFLLVVGAMVIYTFAEQLR
jgi:hypothetical protein